MDKENDINFIKKFSSIKLSEILKKNKIDPSNFYKGKISEEKTKLIKDELDRNIISLYYDRMIKDED